MFNIKQRIVLVIVTLFLCNSFLQAESLNIAFDYAKPPYIYKKEKSGFEIELLKGVLKSMGHQTIFHALTFIHPEKLIKSDMVDVLMTVNNNVISDNTLLSDSYVNYQNVAISLAKSQIKINNIKELDKYNVVAFKAASKLLGSEFGAMSDTHEHYFEVENQLKQVSLLFSGKADVIIIDMNIFNFYREQVMLQTGASVDYHEIFPITEYKVAFHEKALVSTFNQTLAEFKRSNEYELLLEKYNIKQSL